MKIANWGEEGPGVGEVAISGPKVRINLTGGNEGNKGRQI
jgi:hypothetical protein